MDNLSNLVRQAQEGNKEAFGEIYGIFMQRIFRFIHFSINDRHLTEGLTQNTFIRAWNSIGSFSLQGGSFQAFLFTVARNLVIDHYRKKKNISLENVPDISYQDEVEENLTKDEEKEKLNVALLKLDDFERLIIILRYFEDMTIAEIASVVKKREGAVRVRIHRSLGKLKKHLGNK